MEARTLEQQLLQALRTKSGLEKKRTYLGMSGIAKCPHRLYQEFIQGRLKPRDRDHWYCWSGYLFEDAVLDLLGAKKEEVEVVAAFDARFRGHVDHTLPEQVLLEIKSVNFEKFCRIRETRQPDEDHIAQAQMYMRHGGWEKCLVVYIARDVPGTAWRGIIEAPPILTLEILPDRELADLLDKKAAWILECIDEQRPPNCDCGWCRR